MKIFTRLKAWWYRPIPPTQYRVHEFMGVFSPQYSKNSGKSWLGFIIDTRNSNGYWFNVFAQYDTLKEAQDFINVSKRGIVIHTLDDNL